MTHGDRIAVAGFVCSVAVVVVALLMFLVSFLGDAPGVVGFLLNAVVILWVSGLVLSLMARSRTRRFRRWVTTGLTVSLVTGVLLIVLGVYLVMLIDQLLDGLF